MRYWGLVFCLIIAWALAADLLVPAIWKMYFHHHRLLADVDRITHTADGNPGDPLNIALVGSESQIIRAMTAAGWYPADPNTFHSSLRIVVDSVFRRPDHYAPVSKLFLFDRKQDLAFEQPIGNSPPQRHHVRFWRSDKSENGRPLWIGATTIDKSVGLSHTTGEVTHHIGPDVDVERIRIVDELEKVDWAHTVIWEDNFHHRLEGRNGGGDPWHTDGRLALIVLRDLTNRPENGKLS
ncbi:MAG TPA: LssY C-terminal domain-containing protein [Terrimicrobiaceae bacterium]